MIYHLELIEAYGTGISKIMEAYAGTGKEPKIKTSDNVFKIILPNLNVYAKQEELDAAPLQNSVEKEAEICIITLQSK